VKSQLPGGIQQLAVAGDEGAALGPAAASSQSRCQLQSIGGLQRKSIHKPLRLLAQRLTRFYLLPIRSHPVQPDQSLYVFVG